MTAREQKLHEAAAYLASMEATRLGIAYAEAWSAKDFDKATFIAARADAECRRLERSGSGLATMFGHTFEQWSAVEY